MIDATARGSVETGSVASLARVTSWEAAVWGGASVWAIAVFLLVRDRYLDFRFARYDLGNMVQAVWSTTQGRSLEWTNGATGEQMVRLGAHVDPILALLAPLWMAVPSPLTLIAVQVAAVASGAIPLFWLARKHLVSERVAALLALAYLAYPWTTWAAVDVFHPVILAIPLFLFAFWFLDGDRLVAFALCAGLAAMTGELMGLVVAALGVWYALARARRVAGAVIAAAGAGWTAFALIVVVPRYSGGESVFYGAYEDVGGSPLGVLRTTFTDPLRVVSAVTGQSDIVYVLLLAAPLAGLFVLAPWLAAVALPQLAVNLLASRTHTTDPHAHYVAGILPFLFTATALGLARLSERGRERAALLVLVLCISATVMVGPWPGTVLGASNWDSLGTLDTRKEHVQALERAVALVPDDAPVSATNRVGSHLAARRYAFSAPVVGRAEWIVLDVNDTWVPEEWGGRVDARAIGDLRNRISKDPAWRTLLDEDGVVVFRKG